MSSGYRGGGYRGGRGGYDRGFGGYRGRGGYKPRRYWDRDSDDYHRRDRDRDRRDRRRSRSRSRSRSDSRSRSRSESRSHSRSRSPEPRRERDKASSPPRTTEEYQPAPVVPPSQFPVQLKDQFVDAYDPDITSRKKEKWSNDPPTYVNQQQLPKSQNGQITAVPPPTISAQYAVEQYQQMQYQMANYQKQQQLQQAQADAYNILNAGKGAPVAASITSSTGTGFGTYGDRGQGFQAQKQQLPDDLYQPEAYGATHEEQVATKKRKESRKKKRRRKSSSSSSSSSSESSDSRTKQKRKPKSKRDSDNSSDSSSEEDTNSQSKVKPGGLTSQQREALMKQGDSYKNKLEILEREIKRLRSKEDELAIAKADIKLIEENLKLQAELKGRCKAVNIVLEKINTVLRGEISLDSKPKPVAPPPPKISQSASSPCPAQQVTLVTSPPLVKKKDEKHKHFDYFDNGLHWCRLCNVFPESVGAILEHFHSIDHQAQVEQLGIDEKPWHKRNSLKEARPEAGALKVPFKGIQFFTPVQGWYCRICSTWIGDLHCATEHLKSEDHNNNFTNFLDEHPDWETKWLTDREKARVRSGLSTSFGGDQRQQQQKSGKYSFETDEAKGGGVRYQPGVHDFNDDENSKSIRVQMRNMVKENEARPVVMPVLAPSNKDTTVEEWMGKTQPQNVPIDIDTQKFAEIVRQKHGVVKEKEKELVKKVEPAKPPAPNYFRGRDSGRDRDYDYEPNRRFSDKRYEPRADLSFHVRERDDRDRGRGGRFGRRRSRSKSRDRSRSRERDSRRRRDRSRSKSHERDRGRKRSPDAKERDPIRRLPMIGKMPLYKKPTATGKEAESSGSTGGKAQDSATPNNEYGPTPPATVTQAVEQPAAVTPGLAAESVPSDSALAGYGYGMNYDTGSYGSAAESNQNQATKYQNSAAKRGSDDMKPPGESAAPTTGTSGGPLPDDLQHALDIIYSGAAGGKPSTIPFPPPGMGITAEQMGMPPPAAPAYDYAAAYNYMGYEPYQHSFEGYAPVSEYGGEMSEMSSVPQGSGNSAMSMPTENEAEMYTVASDTNFSSYEPKPEPEPSAEDDIEDLRMLGIDVDDVAAVNMK